MRLWAELIDKTMLDYSVDIEHLMLEEYERKKKYCIWADKGGIKYLGCKRGVTLGNPIGQMLGNLALSLVDYAMIHIEHAKGYHRHCDDITFFAETKEEAVRLLGRLDYWCNQYGLCLKASGHVAELHNEETGVIDISVPKLSYLKLSYFKKRTFFVYFKISLLC